LKIKNIFLILIDALRYDFIKDHEHTNTIPNINTLISSGVKKEIISNGSFTQVAVPTVLTQTYPLDYDGHNFGIKNRPKSFIEILKEKGFGTNFVAATHITGPLRYYERGCDNVLNLCDHRSFIEMYLRQYLNHEISMVEKKKKSKAQFDKTFQKTFKDIIDYCLNKDIRTKKNIHRHLGRIGKSLERKLLNEKKILINKPDLVLKKIKFLSSNLYPYFLGEERVNRKKLFFVKIIEKVKSVINKICITMSLKTSMSGYKLFPNYMIPCAREIFDHSFEMIKNKKKKQFSFIHIMDAHHCENTGRLSKTIKNFRFLPKLYKNISYLSRGLFYDLSLMYIDKELGRFINKLKRINKYDDSLFILFGDHGIGRDLTRDTSLLKELGLRGYYEHLNVPIIISPLKNKKPIQKGLHNTMSVSASILDLLNIRGHSSFEGNSIFNKGDSYVISESTGKGNCDIFNKKIFFIITGNKFKLMVSYFKNNFQALRLYNLLEDPKEKNNLVDKKEFSNQKKIMIQYLKNKRKKLFMKIK